MRSMFPIKQGMRRTLCRQSTCTSQTMKLDLFHLSELSCFPSYTITLTPHNIVSCERISQITCDWKLFFETLGFDLNNNVILFEHEITYPNRFSKLFAKSQARIFSWFSCQGKLAAIKSFSLLTQWCCFWQFLSIITMEYFNFLIIYCYISLIVGSQTDWQR